MMAPIGNDDTDAADRFDRFARHVDRRLWLALVPQVGAERAGEAVNEALLYAWRHWPKVESLDNPGGYLYRLALRAATRPGRAERAIDILPRPEPADLPEVEPELVPALLALSESQRTVVWLVEGCGWGLTDTARLLEVSVSTARNHLARGMKHLRAHLEVTLDA
ncbi:MAG: sigma-70 family RNA polymerase sigma factor [Acidimicrobiia bacterium]|nr:sigma-70 family RNA polymerase sigma factor [Acidimicrobiia bacterium]